jgi:hypothetical protein
MVLFGLHESSSSHHATQVKAGVHQSADRDKALEVMLDRAATPALPTEELQRLTLNRWE